MDWYNYFGEPLRLLMNLLMISSYIPKNWELRVGQSIEPSKKEMHSLLAIVKWLYCFPVWKALGSLVWFFIRTLDDHYLPSLIP